MKEFPAGNIKENFLEEEITLLVKALRLSRDQEDILITWFYTRVKVIKHEECFDRMAMDHAKIPFKDILNNSKYKTARQFAEIILEKGYFIEEDKTDYFRFWRKYGILVLSK